jgi:hypothetical protein
MGDDMVSETNSLPPSLAPIVQGSAISPTAKVSGLSGSNLPPGGNSAATSAVGSSSITGTTATTPVTDANDANSLVAFLNKFLNDSGLPDQFRVDPASGGKFIQEINPASGQVLAEYAIAEFPALARGIGASGLLLDGVA